MVQLTLRLLQREGTGRGHQNWIDSLRVYCKAGHGGSGNPKFGGVGGDGGNVIIRTAAVSDSKQKSKKNNPEAKSLLDIFRKNFKSDPKYQKLVARPGSDSTRHAIFGKPGEDKVLTVPCGVAITDDNRNLLFDLDQPGQEFRVVTGGSGGNKPTGFIGLPGQRRHVRLEMKLLADIGLVGFPNAGKSTLLNAISRARPKIASYPFTTIKPNLGHLEYPDERVITMADLPGLIEGAHYNVGMGHHFLKHVERTKLMLFVVDVHGFKLGPDHPHRTAFETTVLLNRELELYNRDLLRKPMILVTNKMDLPGSRDKLKEFHNALFKNYDEAIKSLDEELRPEERVDFRDVVSISADKDPAAVGQVKNMVRDHLDTIHDEQIANEEKVKEFTNELGEIMSTENKGPLML